MMIATSAPRRSARRRLRTDSAFGNVVADLQRAVVKVARERGPIDWLRRLSPALVGGLLVGLAMRWAFFLSGRHSVPCHEPGTAQVGLMIASTQNTDRKILEVGLAVEQVVSRRG